MRVQLFNKLDSKAEKVCKFGCSVYFCLPGVLALAEHSGSHEFVAVFGADEICGFEINGGAICPGSSLPGLFVSESRFDCLSEVGRRSFTVGGVVGCLASAPVRTGLSKVAPGA